MRPAVFLILLLLAGCEDRVKDDINRAYAQYELRHVSGSDE